MNFGYGLMLSWWGLRYLDRDRAEWGEIFDTGSEFLSPLKRKKQPS